jgi:hypothetical protein
MHYGAITFNGRDFQHISPVHIGFKQLTSLIARTQTVISSTLFFLSPVDRVNSNLVISWILLGDDILKSNKSPDFVLHGVLALECINYSRF